MSPVILQTTSTDTTAQTLPATQTQTSQASQPALPTLPTIPALTDAVDSAGQTTNGANPNGSHTQDQSQQQDTKKLAAHLDEALKNSDYKAEIVNGRSGSMIVKIVDSKSGQLLMQLPPQAVLDLVAAISDPKGSKSEPILPSGGTMIDQFV